MSKHQKSIFQKYFKDILTEPQAKHAFSNYEPVTIDDPVEPDEILEKIMAKYDDIILEKTEPRVTKKEINDTLKTFKSYKKKGLGIVGEHGRISD